MALFQTSVLKKHLADLNPKTVENAFQVFRQKFQDPARQENIRNSKEEEYQEGFLRDLFVDVLGYTLKPASGFNLVAELKNQSDAKKADGAILAADGTAIAVIELKGTNTTDFKKIEEQGFGYKNQQRGCRYVITANFERLRFYLDDATEFEEFDLFRLDQERFTLLWLCLEKNYLLSGLPADIKNSSVVAEETVTRKLYADYSKFKKELFADLCQRNPQYDKLLLFQKSQKLLDRLLFIFFAEDRGLLPPNAIHEILTQWQELRDQYDEEFSLYSRFKKFFGYLNTGYQGKKYEIFGYNGGLFAPDEVLDQLDIGDTPLFNGAWAITRYDFVSEVDVDILGHIFEHSLNELEEIQAEIEGKALDRAKTKRKKDGVFYTPKYITRYIVENTVGALCRQKQAEIGLLEEDYADRTKAQKRRKELNERLNQYQHWLEHITILDPACGSGAFLNAALHFLIEEHARHDRLRATLFGDSLTLREVGHAILENNIFGVDINDESVEIAQLALWLRTAQKGRKLTALSRNIRVGNSLISDPAVAGSKAFNWQEAFPEVFAKGGFDVVIGNPPYVRADSLGNDIGFRSHMTKSNNWQTLSGKWDLYIPFVELAIKLVKPNGYTALIIPDAFCHATYAQTSTTWLKANHFLTMIDYFPDIDVFENVGVKSVIIHCVKTKNMSFIQRIHDNHGWFEERILTNYPENLRLDAKASLDLKGNFIALNQICYISVGIVGNAHEKEFKGEFEVADLLSNHQDELHPKLYYEGKDIEKWKLINRRYIEYGTERSPQRWRRKAFQELFEGSPKLVTMRSPGYTPRTFLDLDNGYFNESAIGLKKWINLKGVENKSIKLAYSDEVERQQFENISESFDYLFLLGILNSSLIRFELNRERRSNIHIYPEDWKTLKIPQVALMNQKPLINLVQRQIQNEKDIHTLTTRLPKLLQSKYPALQLTKKISEWHAGTYADFLKEIKRQKLAWGLREEAEWMEYFQQEQAEVHTLQAAIQQTDAEIDRLVYQLYGLTEEEIAVVEGVL